MAEIKTDERPASKARDEIIREAKRLEETTLYSMKGHHCAARRWGGMNLWLGIPAVIISAVVGAAAFSQYSKDYPWLGIVAGFLAISGAVLSGVTTFLNPNDKENAHVTAAHAFDTLNNDCRLFWSIDCWREDSEEILTSKLRELVDRKNELNSNSPQIPQWAYKHAKVGIEAGEAKFQVDSEAPAALPAAGPDAAAGP